jgi:putative membrane protein
MDRYYRYFIFVVSIAVPSLVAYLIYRPMAPGPEATWTGLLPHFNAAVNATCCLLLVMGFYFIRIQRVSLHRATMLTAFILGCLFFVAYIVYHSAVPSTSFGGEGTIRVIYYFLLITHIILAAVVAPFVLLALYYALKKKIPQHKRIVKFTYPIWLYVSITGVLVYLLIRPYY